MEHIFCRLQVVGVGATRRVRAEHEIINTSSSMHRAQMSPGLIDPHCFKLIVNLQQEVQEVRGENQYYILEQYALSQPCSLHSFVLQV